MNYAIIQKTETQVNYSSFYINSSKKGSLIAQWFVVDNKLVCKWLVN